MLKENPPCSAHPWLWFKQKHLWGFCFQGHLWGFLKIGSRWVLVGSPYRLVEGAQIQESFQNLQNLAHAAGARLTGYDFSFSSFTESDRDFLPIGWTHKVNLKDFDLAGKKRKEIRRALNLCGRKKISFKEISTIDLERLKPHLISLSKNWLSSRTGPKIGLYLQDLSLSLKTHLPYRHFILYREDSRILAYVNILPIGDHNWMLDYLVYEPNGERMSSDMILSQLIKKIGVYSTGYLDLGLSPFIGVNAQNISHFLLLRAGLSGVFYRAKGQYQFKRKYADEREQRFILFPKKQSTFRDSWALTRATYPHLFQFEEKVEPLSQ